MIGVNDIKNGLTIKIDNDLFQVIEFQHVKPGKGSAFVRTKLKNLRTGTTVEHGVGGILPARRGDNVQRRVRQAL